MMRRNLLAAAGALSLAGCGLWPKAGIINPCRSGSPPAWLAGHDLVLQALEGIRADQLWDAHVHLLGTGDGGGGIWLNPALRSLLHPIEFGRFRFFLNASCVDPAQADVSYVARLLELRAPLPPGARLLLLAFDYSYDEDGGRRRDLSAFHVPDAYAARIAARYPEVLGWIASIHPYREDCTEALTWAAVHGAVAVKWLPQAMAIDPAAPLCDRFYEALIKARLPLLVHGGAERAVHGAGRGEFGNPLRLRRPLEYGVRVIVAHCASLGASVDLDAGSNGPRRSNIELFARLMEEPDFEGRLYGEISAITQVNRLGVPLETVVTRSDWHHRLINGSDYPLPAVMPLFSPRAMVERNYLSEADARVLIELRPYNALLFDLLLKRGVRIGKHRFAPAVFESRRVFDQGERL